MSIFFSVIIPTFNRIESLQKCLDRLNPAYQLCKLQYEVIVTDDSHNHLCHELIRSKFNWVKYIKGPQKGAAANRNHGARNASGRWLIFLDDDCVPDVQILEQYRVAIFLNSQIKVFEGLIFPDKEPNSFLEEAPINIEGGALFSCNFMILRHYFCDSLNGFDEKFPYAAVEDVEFHYRLKKVGCKIIFVSKARVMHPFRRQSKMIEMTLKRMKSVLYFYDKHLELYDTISIRIVLMNISRIIYRETFSKLIRYKLSGLGVQIVKHFIDLYYNLFLVLKKYIYRYNLLSKTRLSKLGHNF